MSTPRIARIKPTLNVDATVFQIRFSADNGDTWTSYDPANASPAVPADILVSALNVDGEYLIDGVNHPSDGNTIAACYGGNLYEVREETGGGLSGWSDPFQAFEKLDPYGPIADVASLLAWLKELGFEFDQTSEQLEAFLGRLLLDAKDDIAISPDASALYKSTDLTDPQSRYLAQTERYITLCAVIENAAVLRTLGLHAPLLVEDSQAMLTAAKYYGDKGDARLAKLIASLGDDPSEPGTFAIPSLFTVAHGCRGR